MTISIEFADGKGGRTPGVDVATNSGWVEFGAWVDTFPEGDEYLRPIQLWEHGSSFHTEELIAQLKRAFKTMKPSKYVRSVAENVIALCERHLRKSKRDPAAEGVFVSDDS
jgi:hypothetical protein